MSNLPRENRIYNTYNLILKIREMKQFIWRELKIIKQDPKLIITLPIALIILLILLPFKKLFFFRFGFCIVTE